jgi:hypothetical protein
MSDKKIILISDWGGAVAGTSLSISDVTVRDLINRGIAEENNDSEDKKKLSARKGAVKNGGKDDK